MKKIPLLLFLSFIMIFSLIPVTSTQAFNDSPTKTKMIHENSTYPIDINGIKYSLNKNNMQYNEIKKSIVYYIMDQDGTLYGYKSKLEYETALNGFEKKWSDNRIEAANYTALYKDAGYKGWFLDVPVGRAYNLSGSYNDILSSLITASNGRGTTICVHHDATPPCKTYAPGLSINYVGDDWNDKVTYVYTRP